MPAQLAKPGVVAILAGIKVYWNAGTEDNISHYKVERQESDNNIDWSGWSTIIEVDATMWLDLLLTYTKYYRYRVSTITQTGTSSTPSDPTNSAQPNQAGTGDVVNFAITADKIAANSVYTNALQAGAVIGSKVASGTLLISNLSSEAVNRMFQSSDYKTNIENWVKSGDITYIDGGKIYAGSITLSGGGGAAADFDWSHLGDDGDKPADNADVTANNTAYDTNYVNGVISSIVSNWRYGATTYINGGSIYCTNLAAINALLGTVHSGTIYGTRFRVGGGSNEDIYFEDSGIRMYDAGSHVIVFYKSGYRHRSGKCERSA